MSSVPQRLRIARQQAGLSQGQVARMLDWHRPTVSEVEAGRRRVTADEIVVFARIYSVSVNWLTASEPDQHDLDPRVQLAARELARLNPEDLDKVLKLLATMREGEEST